MEARLPGIDPSRTFTPLRIAVLTVSDTRSIDTDTSGQTLVERLQKAGHLLADRRLVLDERTTIAAALRAWAEGGAVDVVLVTGGTGVTARDVTPEAIGDVIDKEIPGFGELFRAQSLANIGVSTIQSRALAGVARGTYIFGLPGSTGACKDAWDGILVHQLDSRYRPCNFAELLPRLIERKPPSSGVSAADVERFVTRWCAAVEARHIEVLSRMYSSSARLALPDAGHEGPTVVAKAVVERLGGRPWNYESFGGAQVELGASTATDIGTLTLGSRASFVVSWVWRAEGGQILVQMQQIAPAA